MQVNCIINADRRIKCQMINFVASCRVAIDLIITTNNLSFTRKRFAVCRGLNRSTGCVIKTIFHNNILFASLSSYSTQPLLDNFFNSNILITIYYNFLLASILDQKIFQFHEDQHDCITLFRYMNLSDYYSIICKTFYEICVRHKISALLKKNNTAALSDYRMRSQSI